jgi:hypothetical protein
VDAEFGYLLRQLPLCVWGIGTILIAERWLFAETLTTAVNEARDPDACGCPVLDNCPVPASVWRCCARSPRAVNPIRKCQLRRGSLTAAPSPVSWNESRNPSATDPLIRRRFVENPAAVLRQFQEEGCELTAVEIEALAATDPEAIRSFGRWASSEQHSRSCLRRPRHFCTRVSTSCRGSSHFVRLD